MRLRDADGDDAAAICALYNATVSTTTVAWTEEHHLDPARWNVEPRLANALKAADGD